MAVMNIKGFIYTVIERKLKKFGEEGRILLTILNFLHYDCIQDLIKEWDDEFNSNVGRPSYPRVILFGILMYCSKMKIRSISKIVRECEINRVLRVFTCGCKPSRTTFKRFLKESNSVVFRKIFIYSLVLFNDYDFLKFTKGHIDGTDALIRGSKYYTINKDVIKSLKWMKKHKLLHNNRKKSVRRTIRELNKMREEYQDDKEMDERLDLIFNNMRIYNKNVYRKIPEFEVYLNEKDIDYVSITFPAATMMKTKKGKFDFAFNLQEVITENDVLIGGALLDHPNDTKALGDVMKELEINLEILLEMQEKYGERRNYKEIKRMFENAIYICDSGYFTEENLEYMDKHGYKCLIMPSRLSREINRKLREQNNIEPKKNKKDNRMNHLTITYNGFICEKGHKVTLINTVAVNKKVNIREGIPTTWKEHRYIFSCEHCHNCSENNICNCENLTIKTTPLQYDMSNKFTKQTYLEIYDGRFHSSEFINGVLKGTDGILSLSGTDTTSINNEMHILNTTFNIFHLKSMKGTAY